MICEMGNTSLALCRGVARHDFGAFISSDVFNEEKPTNARALIDGLYKSLPQLFDDEKPVKQENLREPTVYESEQQLRVTQDVIFL